jgi:hypothetical protein
MSSSSSSDSEIEVSVEKPRKVTIPPSERKKASTAKALEALAAKRKSQKDDKKKEEKKVKAAEALAERVVDTEPKPVVAPAQPSINVDEIKNQLKEELKREADQEKANKKNKKKPVKKKKKPETESESESSSEEEIVVKKPKSKKSITHQKVASAPQQPVFLSGSQLLDELFFQRKF